MREKDFLGYCARRGEQRIIMSNEQQNYGGTGVSQESESTDLETQRIGSGRRGKQANLYNPAELTKIEKIAFENDEEKRLVPSTIQLKTNINRNDDARNERRQSSWSSLRGVNDLNSLAESVFSDIRSESTATRLSISNEAEEYEHCTAYQRAFPERSIALIVTLIFELPTLFLISGGSDRLCVLIGRKKYTTLIALLPIISAISGNVGLQASTLTTRAISHEQVRVDNYAKWLGEEIMAAFYLGIAIGVVTSSISFLMGGFSLPFALSIFTAQFVGILTAGCTGTLAPLLFTFIFKRDSGKWGGPLETAVQDVVGSFAMIVVTYQIMLLFGPFELEPSDMC